MNTLNKYRAISTYSNKEDKTGTEVMISEMCEIIYENFERTVYNWSYKTYNFITLFNSPESEYIRNNFDNALIIDHKNYALSKVRLKEGNVYAFCHRDYLSKINPNFKKESLIYFRKSQEFILAEKYLFHEGITETISDHIGQLSDIINSYPNSAEIHHYCELATFLYFNNNYLGAMDLLDNGIEHYKNNDLDNAIGNMIYVLYATKGYIELLENNSNTYYLEEALLLINKNLAQNHLHRSIRSHCEATKKEINDIMSSRNLDILIHDKITFTVIKESWETRLLPFEEDYAPAFYTTALDSLKTFIYKEIKQTNIVSSADGYFEVEYTLMKDFPVGTITKCLITGFSHEEVSEIYNYLEGL